MQSAMCRVLIQQRSAFDKRFALCALRSALPGYTLIEVLVALAILVIGVSALATMTNQARQSAKAAEELSSVQLACQTRVNEMLSGIRTITPSFNEAVTGLDDWFLTTELFPATKPGMTAVRVHMSRRQPPGGTTTARVAGADFFEITQWVGNARIDSQLLQAMQQNPYSLTVGGMMMANQPGGMMGGMMGGGPANLTDLMTANNTIPGGGFAGGMPNNMMRPYAGGFGSAFDTIPDAPPPLSLDNGTGTRTTAFTTSEERRAFRESRAQNSLQTAGQSAMPDDLPDAPPPLDIPLEDPFDANASAATSTTTESSPAASPRTRTTTTPPTTPPLSEDTQPPDVPQMPNDTQGDGSQDGNTSPRTPGGRQGGGGSGGSGGNTYGGGYGTTDGGGTTSGYGTTGTGGNTGGRGGNRPTPGGGN